MVFQVFATDPSIGLLVVSKVQQSPVVSEGKGEILFLIIGGGRYLYSGRAPILINRKEVSQ